MLNKKVQESRKKKNFDMRFKPGTLWLTALVQSHCAKQALMCPYRIARNFRKLKFSENSFQ